METISLTLLPFCFASEEVFFSGCAWQVENLALKIFSSSSSQPFSRPVKRGTLKLGLATIVSLLPIYYSVFSSFY